VTSSTLPYCGSHVRSVRTRRMKLPAGSWPHQAPPNRRWISDGSASMVFPQKIDAAAQQIDYAPVYLVAPPTSTSRSLHGRVDAKPRYVPIT